MEIPPTYPTQCSASANQRIFLDHEGRQSSTKDSSKADQLCADIETKRREREDIFNTIMTQRTLVTALSLILYAALVDRISAATHQLPPLPYSRNALEPHIHAQTLEFHHKKHHLKYVNTLNQLVDKTDLDGLPLQQVMEAAAERNLQKVYNNAAQAWNHEFYFNCMRPPPDDAKDAIVPDRKGIIGKAIKESFGNYKVFRRMFVDAANNTFGSGWAWLVYDAKNDVLQVKVTIGAENPLTAGDGEFVPLLTIDVWEHAYYLDYQNMRSDYVDAFVDKLIDWNFVEENLKDAIKNNEKGSSRLASGEL